MTLSLFAGMRALLLFLPIVESYVHWIHQSTTFDSTPMKYGLYIGNSRYKKNDEYVNVVVRSNRIDPHDIVLTSEISDFSHCLFDHIEIDEENLMLNPREKKTFCRLLPTMLRPGAELLVVDLHEQHPFMSEFYDLSPRQIERYYPGLYLHHKILSERLLKAETFSTESHRLHRYINTANEVVFV